MSFMKGFFSIFNCMSPMEEKLDDTIQDLYDRMNWGKYSYPNINSSYVSGNDIDRVLEAENEYNSILIKKNKVHKDPARPRRTFYERKYYEK